MIRAVQSSSKRIALTLSALAMACGPESKPAARSSAPSAPSEAGPEEPLPCQAPLVVATYNIRYDNPEDGVHAWPNRRSQVVEQIAHLAPDLLGVQEAEHHQLDFIREQMVEYDVEGVARDGGQEGEYSALLFRKNRFEKLDGGTFWLSPTPQGPRSAEQERPWGTHLNRISSWLKLRDLQSRATWLVVNVHFDHLSEEARVKSAAQIIDFTRAKSPEVDSLVVMGDFNARTDSTPHKLLDGKQANESGATSLVADARHRARKTTTASLDTTVTSWTGLVEDLYIDHVFVSPNVQVLDYRVVEQRLSYAGQERFASDHLPVRTELCDSGERSSD